MSSRLVANEGNVIMVAYGKCKCGLILNWKTSVLKQEAQKRGLNDVWGCFCCIWSCYWLEYNGVIIYW